MKQGVWPSPRSGRMKTGSTRRIRVVEIDHVASDSLNFCRPLKRALINIFIVLPSSELLGYFRTSAARTLSINAS